MFLIEPCCTQKHWPQLREKVGANGTVPFHGYGDLSLEELFPVLMTRYSHTSMMFVCPTLPNSTAALLEKWLSKGWGSDDANINVISSMHLITDLRPKKSPTATKWAKENPFPGHLVLHNVQQNDTAILLPDIAIYGNINLVHNGHFTALVSTNPGFINNLWSTYEELISK